MSTLATEHPRPVDAVTVAADPLAEYVIVVLKLMLVERVEVLLDVLGGRNPAWLPRRALVAVA